MKVIVLYLSCHSVILLMMGGRQNLLTVKGASYKPEANKEKSKAYTRHRQKPPEALSPEKTRSGDIPVTGR